MKKLLPFFTFLVLFSCEYHREQKVPEGVKSILKEECVLPPLYYTKVYEIQNKSELSQWQENLFCEGAESTKLQPWVSYSKLPKKEQDFISELFIFRNGSDDKCKIIGTMDLEKIYFAACLSENINPSNNEIRTFYHNIYILNENKTLFIDIEFLQSI